MPLFIAVILGIVEGLTEYLPISSTGHLVLVGHWLGLADDDAGAKAFEIVVQLGAILAVLVHYRALLASRIRGLWTNDPRSYRLLSSLAIAFTPAAVIGVFLRKTIKTHLQAPLPVAAALVCGGIVMIVVARWLRGRPEMPAHAPPNGGTDSGDDLGLDAVSRKRALVIGIGQCFSLWPGTSRSMSTIVAGQLAGLPTTTAAEFSFLLALPTLGAATLYEGYKSHDALAAGVGLPSMVAGLVVSFVVAWAVIATFLKYLKSHGLEPFGWYRVIVGGLVFWIFGR